MVNTNCCGGCRIFVPVLSKGSLEPMGELFMEDGTAGDWCDNVLLEWTAGLELLARNHMKAVMPIIACEQGGGEFSWTLPETLSNKEHEPTTDAVKKHLRKHSSANEVESGSHVLDGVRDMVADVTSDVAATVSVTGVVQTMMRFQGIVLTDRDNLTSCVERIAEKVSGILDPSNDEPGSPSAAPTGKSRSPSATPTSRSKSSTKGAKSKKSAVHRQISNPLFAQNETEDD